MEGHGDRGGTKVIRRWRENDWMKGRGKRGVKKTLVKRRKTATAFMMNNGEEDDDNDLFKFAEVSCNLLVAVCLQRCIAESIPSRLEETKLHIHFVSCLYL